MTFAASYADWIDPTNGFIQYLTYSKSNPGGGLSSCEKTLCSSPLMARVIFSAGGTYCNVSSKNGNCPSSSIAPSTTVSEGIGYALLLSCANNDEANFKAFLQYWYFVAQTYGCSLYDATTTFSCLTSEPYQMPWIVDQTGQPFSYSSATSLSGISSQNTFFSSGSATDADIQIAWAVYLAIKKFGDNTIWDINGNQIHYSTLATNMTLAIRKNDINVTIQNPPPPGSSTITFVNQTNDTIQLDYPQNQNDFSSCSGSLLWNGSTYLIAPGTGIGVIGSLPNINNPNYGPSLQISDWASGQPAFSYNVYLGNTPTIKQNPNYPTQTNYTAQINLNGNNTTITISKIGKLTTSSTTDLYNPGSQWGSAGSTVLYPGYMTPQAFDIFDQNSSTNQFSLITNCTTAPGSNLLQIINTTEVVLNIDAPTSSSIFNQPWPQGLSYSSGSFKIAPLANLTLTMNNLFNSDSDTLQISSYDGSGKAIFTYTLNSNGTFATKIKNETFTGCSQFSGNGYQIVIQDLNIQAKLNFSFQDVAANSLKMITNFQNQYKTGLIPNVVQIDGVYNSSTAWSNAFAYDAIRFPLWVSSYLAKNPTSPLAPALKSSLSNLLNTIENNASSWIQNGTFANQGIDGTITPPNIVGGSSAFLSPAIALNAPLFAACTLTDKSTYASIISPLQNNVVNYDLSNPLNQPSITNSVGDSSPYFSAAMLLLSIALINKML